MRSVIPDLCGGTAGAAAARRPGGKSSAALCSILLLLAVFALGCAERERLAGPEEPPASWELGPPTDHPLTGQAGQVVVDANTGAEFLLPTGGKGVLRVASVLSGPAAPFEGTGFWIGHDGTGEVQLLTDAAAGERVMLFGYGPMEGAVNEPAAGSRWISIPPVDTVGGKIVCRLPLQAGGKSPAESWNPSPPFPGRGASGDPGARAPLDAPGGFDTYWISSIRPGAAVIDTMLNIELQASTFIDAWLATLAPARRASAEAEVRGRLSPRYAFDGLWYQGFWWRSLGAHGRRVHPTLHYRTTANAGNVAHELGHYFNHVLVGDDIWSTLEGQAPLWDTGHGIRDVVGRGVLLEDYAYLAEFHLIGSVKGYDLFEPRDIFRDLTPLGSDFPSLEGFGAVMLASLARSNGQVRDLTTGSYVPVPVVNRPWSDIYELIAAGETGIDGLRARIESALGPEAVKLPAMLQRCGWRYSVAGRYVDAAGAGVPGVTTTAVSRIGDEIYTGGFSTLESAADGAFSVVGGVFGGASELRAVKGPDTAYVNLRIDWNQPTNARQQLGNCVVSFPPVITSIAPASGAPGTRVTIEGRNFGTAAANGQVAFAGVVAAVETWTDTEILVTVPAGARSGPLTVTRGGTASNGVDFTVTGVGRWVLLEVQEDDWQVQPGQFCSIVEQTITESTFSLHCGYDNPNFPDPHPVDWETYVTASWTVPPSELAPGQEVSITLNLETTIVLADVPPTQSDRSQGWTYVMSWASSPPTVRGTGTQTTTHVVRAVQGDPASDRLTLRIAAGSYTGQAMRVYVYGWQE